jgi:hypothetical protein
MIKDINRSFDIQELGEPTRLLGIQITRQCELGTIHISQPAFINTIAKCFDIIATRVTNSLMDHNVELGDSSLSSEVIDYAYASIIGSVNYCSITTRPDISYAVNKCTQYSSKPNITHWEAA